MWVCLCVLEEEEDDEREQKSKLVCRQRRERKKEQNCEINKTLGCKAIATVYIYTVTIAKM